MESVYNEILEGVGKKIRNAYFAKNITANKVMECYQRNLKKRMLSLALDGLYQK